MNQTTIILLILLSALTALMSVIVLFVMKKLSIKKQKQKELDARINYQKVLKL